MYCLGSVHAVRLYATAQNYYQILDVPLHASLADIKAQFRKLLKKFHPDLNSHLSVEEKDDNSKKYTEMVLAYDTLKDAKRRREYDAKIGRRSSSSTGTSSFRRNGEWRNRHYGDSRAYSRRGAGNYSSSGYNYTRHKVHNFYTGEGSSGQDNFDGRHKNHGDRYDVPHFNYDEHLAKQLKFEQRIIKKELSATELDLVLRQLTPDGDATKVSDELLTKHLMRQRRSSQESRTVESTSAGALSHQYMYRRPQTYGNETHDSGSSAFTTFAVLGGAGSMYILYKCFGG